MKVKFIKSESDNANNHAYRVNETLESIQGEVTSISTQTLFHKNDDSRCTNTVIFVTQIVYKPTPEKQIL